MPKIISVAQRKGGVGKTTLAVCVAAELANRGADVGLVDADSLQSASDWASLGNIPFPVYDIPLVGTVTEWASEVSRISSSYIVVDAAPNDQTLGACFALSSIVLLPCAPSGLDIEALKRSLDIIRAARARRADDVQVVLVPNRVDARTLEGQQLVHELSEFGEIVAPSIGDRIDFVRAFSMGEAIATFAPGSMADLEIQQLCDLLTSYLPIKASRSAVYPAVAYGQSAMR